MDTPYSQSITATGGTAPYTYSVISGVLPTNLTLSAGGAITGTPTTTGPFSFTINATDSHNFNGSRSYSLTVSPPTITLSPTSLSSPIPVDTPYSQSITATGGTAPYTYIVTSGALPTNLTLSAGGAITGTPTTTGPFSFTINATDSHNFNGSRSYSLTVSPPTITLSPASLTSPISASIPYSQSITATGGTAPYAYIVTSGALPTNLTLSAGGAITGTPITTGPFSFTINATDSHNFNGSRSYSLTVSPPTITLSPTNLSSPIPVDTPYSQSITATGGTAPYTYIVTSGALPTNLTLSPGGAITGTPITTGLFSFTINATDAFNFNGTRPYSLDVE